MVDQMLLWGISYWILPIISNASLVFFVGYNMLKLLFVVLSFLEWKNCSTGDGENDSAERNGFI